MRINPFVKQRSKPKPPRSDVTEALAQLARLAEQHTDLADLAAVHAALLRVAFENALPTPQLAIDAAHAATKLMAGVPLLRGEHLALDPSWLQQRYLQLCDALLALPNGRNDTTAYGSGATEALRQAVSKNKLDIHAAMIEVLAGDPRMIVQRAEQFDLDATLAATLLRWTLLPVLEQVAKQVEPHRKNMSWDKGYCPTCGAWPLLVERRGIEQRLFARCGLCASEWETEHIVCPFCRTRSHFDLAYLYDEAQEATQRVMTCERCHCYYKSVSTLVPLSTPQLLVTDLATLHLDLIALERAYGPPG